MDKTFFSPDEYKYQRAKTEKFTANYQRGSVGICTTVLRPLSLV
jgi:hypothetical protein